MKAVRDGASALTLLDWHTITSIPPSELRRAGAIAERMRAAGFDGIKTQIIVKALFVASSLSERERERHMELAFDVWDEHHRGVLQLTASAGDGSLVLDVPNVGSSALTLAFDLLLGTGGGADRARRSRGRCCPRGWSAPTPPPCRRSSPRSTRSA